jgi:hypothetical protein
MQLKDTPDLCIKNCQPPQGVTATVRAEHNQPWGFLAKPGGLFIMQVIPHFEYCSMEFIRKN